MNPITRTYVVRTIHSETNSTQYRSFTVNVEDLVVKDELTVETKIQLHYPNEMIHYFTYYENMVNLDEPKENESSYQDLLLKTILKLKTDQGHPDTDLVRIDFFQDEQKEIQLIFLKLLSML